MTYLKVYVFLFILLMPFATIGKELPSLEYISTFIDSSLTYDGFSIKAKHLSEIEKQFGKSSVASRDDGFQVCYVSNDKHPVYFLINFITKKWPVSVEIHANKPKSFGKRSCSVSTFVNSSKMIGLEFSLNSSVDEIQKRFPLLKRRDSSLFFESKYTINLSSEEMEKRLSNLSHWEKRFLKTQGSKYHIDYELIIEHDENKKIESIIIYYSESS